MLLFFYILGVILFFITLRQDSENPLWCDIILSLFWFMCITLILLFIIGILIYNIILYIKN